MKSNVNHFLNVLLEYINTSDHYIYIYDLYYWICDHEDYFGLLDALRSNLQFIIYVIKQHNINITSHI